MTFGIALDRYLAEVTPTKKDSTQRAQRFKAVSLRLFFGRYSLAAVNTDLVARYRDRRLDKGKKPNTVRLELALASHLLTTAIRERRIGLVQNPVANSKAQSWRGS